VEAEAVEDGHLQLLTWAHVVLSLAAAAES